MPPEFEEDPFSVQRRTTRKRRRQLSEGKLLVGSSVEVRSLEDGLLGSWYSGTVIAFRPRTRDVRFDRYVAEDGCSILEESVPVSEAIDGGGCRSSSYWGRIRPVPPPIPVDPRELVYGLCVDVYHEDAWWEGVIFDQDTDAKERNVFFPDLGDELVTDIRHIRISQDWNEGNDNWVHRGCWSFFKVIKEYEEQFTLPVSVKQIWYDLREKEDFRNIKEWTSRNHILWEKIVLDTISENFVIAACSILPPFDLEGQLALSLFSSMENSNDNEDHVSSAVMISDDRPITPERCPQAVLEYSALDLEHCRNSGEVAKTLRLKVRDQLEAIGWKFSYRYKGNSRYMVYESPRGRLYTSLRKACNGCIQDFGSQELAGCTMRHVSAGEDVELKSSFSPFETYKISEDHDSSKAMMPYERHILPAGCPQSVFNYYALDLEHCRKSSAKELRLKAKNELLAIGWKIFHRCQGGRRDIYYESPRGRLYCSLRQACEGWVKDCGSQELKCCSEEHVSADEEVEVKSPCKKLSSSVGCALVQKVFLPLTEIKRAEPDTPRTLKLKIKFSGPLAELAKKMGGSQPSSARRSSKKMQETVQHFPHNPKTVLSWLIDKDILLPRAKVYCRSRSSGISLAEGRIHRDGIKCSCCNNLLTIDGFVSHCGGTNCCAAARIFLEDGRSILDCEIQTLHEKNRSDVVENFGDREIHKSHVNQSFENDHVCSVCHYGGDLILCDQCPSSFHTTCLGLKDVPDGDWYCPSCCCGICGEHKVKDDIGHVSTLSCNQCGCKYHTVCLSKRRGIELVDHARGRWYCSKKCEKIHLGLLELEGKQIRLGMDNLTFTLLKPVDYEEHDEVDQKMKSAAENFVKLNIALDVMHECFEDVKEPYSSRDLVEDVIFNRISKLNRLNFRGFYTVLLESNDEVITVATVRIHGERVAEVPLVGTRFQYRRQGMCHTLMNMLEKKLKDLEVEQIVLAAAPSALNTWIGSFGYSKMTDLEKSQFVDQTFLCFQDTIMCKKRLLDTPSGESRVASGTSPLKLADHLHECADIDMDGPETVCEEFQGKAIEGPDIVEQAIKSCNEARSPASKVSQMEESIQPDSKQSFMEPFPESSVTNDNQKGSEGSRRVFEKYYRRRISTVKKAAERIASSSVSNS